MLEAPLAWSKGSTPASSVMAVTPLASLGFQAPFKTVLK